MRISASDRDLMRRLTIVLAFIVVFTAAFAKLNHVYSQKFLATTGVAQWIFAEHPLSSGEPVAFFAARDFTLPAKRYYTRLKIAADPEYQLFVNGREIAGRRVGDQPDLDLYDISSLVQTGRNRVVVAVRAPQGVGGLLVSIDIAPEIQNWVVSDRDWSIYRRWSPDLLLRDVPELHAQSPMIIGAPPIGRWNYLTLVPRTLEPLPSKLIEPRQSFPRLALVPTIRTREGVAVAITDRARATVFDFGFTSGRVRVTRNSDHGVSRVLRLRFANIPDELGLIEYNLRPLVFAPGERTVTTTEAHSFRYVMVFGQGVGAEVVQFIPRADAGSPVVPR
ncbi:MAG: hypothetical protein DMF56_09820 [Acidobacteria bacterium]|nr:MAG: hypothetical protein DMF56_09820 [Acidobacteriota bacterium]